MIESPAPEILFPASGAVFREGQTITCLGTTEGEWYDQTNNLLGRGKSITVSFPQGSYEILFIAGDGRSDVLTITVDPVLWENGVPLYLSGTVYGSEQYLGTGDFSVFLFSFGAVLQSVFYLS